jgi:CheY-like chemotaxis protein
MSKGTILLYDDDKETRERFNSIFSQLDIDIDFLAFEKEEELIEKLKEQDSVKNVKSLIFDLAKDESEIKTHKYSISRFIKENFDKRRIPIFIHSTYMDDFNDFDEYGSVYKVTKSDDSIPSICETLKLMYESGFLNIFCPHGIIEQKIMGELHNAFTKQFKNGDEVIGIIKAVNSIEGINHKDKIIDTFERMAVRSLMSKLMIDKTIEEGQYNEIKISVIEHFIRRTNLKHVPIWTGDIFETNDKKFRVIILTPRCDVASKGKENVLVCGLNKFEEFSKKNVGDFMKDKITDKKFRYLPKTPIFPGGRVDLSDHYILSKKQLDKDFNYLISLSDDLTNEILGKFCAYLLRTSIPEIEEKELINFLK